MGKSKLYRRVWLMTLEELRRERELLGPLIRDVVATKQARICEISEEIRRREQDVEEAQVEGK